jgi:hypothetical protein
LVRGAWHTGSAWDGVAGGLRKLGFPVAVAELHRGSLAADIAAAETALTQVIGSGPVVACGHSYGGAVITGLPPENLRKARPGGDPADAIYVIFAGTMRGTVRDGYLRKSPCVDIRLPEKIPTVVRLLTPAEVLALADAMPGRYSVRDVPAPFFVQEAIADHAERFELGEDDVLCRTPRRTLLRRDYYNREIWQPAVKAGSATGRSTRRSTSTGT